MTEQEAIKAIENNRPTHGYTILCEALNMAIEALEKQAGIERALERLEEAKGTCNGHKCGEDGCAGCVDCKIENAYAEAIKIIKEEVG